MALLWTLLVYFTYLIIAAAIVLKIYLVVTLGRYKISKSLKGKVIIITGGTAGIGKAAVQEFAANGATIHILARDLSKADAVVGEIVASTGNQDITIHKVDLNDFSTIRAFAEKFLTTKSPIHILINNAGLINQRKKLSSDGIEQTVQTNHLGHFLLTNLLLDRMIQSAPSRIINVSSMGHLYVKPKDFDVYDVKLENLPASHYNYGHMAYIASKLMNVLFTRELARRLYGTNVTVNSVHPGAVRTEILRDVHWTHPITILIMMSIPFQKNLIQGAATILYLAVSDDVEHVSGHYFSDCKPAETALLALDDRNAEMLWKESEKLTGLAKS